MKKKVIAAVMAAAMCMAICACGNDDVKTIVKDDANVQTSVDAGQNTSDDAGATGTVDSDNNDSEVNLPGYVFEAEGASGTVYITTDLDMADVLEKLGEPASYYEAASCAFEGLDKIYTYNHFEIDTYPVGDKDLISAILFRDDMIATPEGLSIGDSFDKMESIYGKNYTFENGVYVYSKDAMSLKIIVNENAVVSIEYSSNAGNVTN